MEVQSLDNREGVVDSVVEERLLSRMRKRTEELAQRSEQRRNQQVNRNTELETADAFLTSFHEMKVKLDQDILKSDDLDTGDKDAMIEYFNKMVRDHSLIQQYINESSMFLASFQMKRSQEILAELEAEIQRKMEVLQPKKRFGFGTKASKPKPKAKDSVPSKSDTTDSATRIEMKYSALDELIAKRFFGFKDKSNETLVMAAEEISNRQLNLQNLSHCNVQVLGNPDTIQAAALDNCTILIGPTSRSAFIKNCTSCRFVLACQQVRIHDTRDTQFYIHVTGAAIIESCGNVGFAPYNLEYPLLQEHYNYSGLDIDTNNWDKVDDFKWITKNEKSPNMYLIEEKERKDNWLSGAV
uniref:Tubulin-specific chaperone C-like n=1 Tax=Hirondellea gigas TaxID=1518452 RepID=A0A2P2HYU3_9CRUS